MTEPRRVLKAPFPKNWDEWVRRYAIMRATNTHTKAQEEKREARTPKIEFLNGVTTHEIPADRVLQGALDYGMNSCIVIGYDRDNDEYFSSSMSDGMEALWMLERAKLKLLNMIEQWNNNEDT